LSQKEKLADRLRSKPKDFTFKEVAVLLGHFGYTEISGGKTGGSKVAFANAEKDYIRLHKPHPRNELLPYQVANLINDLTERGLL